MTDQHKTQKPEKQVEDLELNRETLQDLTEGQSEAARGGVAGRPPVGDTLRESCSCNGTCG